MSAPRSSRPPIALICPLAREEASARLDGEELTVDESLLDEHLAQCAECARFERQSAVLRRAMSLRLL